MSLMDDIHFKYIHMNRAHQRQTLWNPFIGAWFGLHHTDEKGLLPVLWVAGHVSHHMSLRIIWTGALNISIYKLTGLFQPLNQRQMGFSHSSWKAYFTAQRAASLPLMSLKDYSRKYTTSGINMRAQMIKMQTCLEWHRHICPRHACFPAESHHNQEFTRSLRSLKGKKSGV